MCAKIEGENNMVFAMITWKMIVKKVDKRILGLIDFN